MTHHATPLFGSCNVFILVGHTNNNVTQPRVFRKCLYKRINNNLSNLDNTLAKTSEICSFQEGVAFKPLSQLPSTSHIYIPSKQNRPGNNTIPTELPLASAKEPLSSRRTARFRTETRVLGCTGPS